MRKKKLKWGQTPWDDMSREELLKTIWRLWVALDRSNGILQSMLFTTCIQEGIDAKSPQAFEAISPYWGKEGMGGAALEMVRQAVDPIQNQVDGETMFRSFFRYADDLLFDQNGFCFIGSNWVVCPKCNCMYGSRRGDMVGKKCSDHPFGKEECGGVFRKLQWEDLRPTKEKGGKHA